MNQLHVVTGKRYKKRWKDTLTVDQLAPIPKLFYKLHPQVGSKYYLYEKVLPPQEALEKWLTPRALAYWYVDDGSLRPNVDALLFSTESFTPSQVDVLRDVLKKKFQLKTSRHVKVKHFRIYLSTNSYARFYELVSPYLISSMQRKLRASLLTKKS